jgi:hypothetical protein
MEKIFPHDHVVDRKPALIAKFNRFGQLIEVERPGGGRATEPMQTFEDKSLPNIELKKLETFNVLVWVDPRQEERICVHWRCRIYCTDADQPESRK